MEHPAVAEAGVIGKPDPVAGEVVKAFVTLKPGERPSDALLSSCWASPASGWAPAVAPRRSSSAPTCPRPAAARSCAGC
jgi:acetyl-CoA synthetase